MLKSNNGRTFKLHIWPIMCPQKGDTRPEETKKNVAEETKKKIAEESFLSNRPDVLRKLEGSKTHFSSVSDNSKTYIFCWGN